MELILALIGGFVALAIAGGWFFLMCYGVESVKDKITSKYADMRADRTLKEKQRIYDGLMEERRIYIENRYKKLFAVKNDENCNEPDDQNVLNELLVSAENNDAVAAFKLGEIYRKGLYNLQQDLTEALKWYRKSNLLEALFWVGFFIGHGLGTGEGEKWFEAEPFLVQAANSGSVKAMEILGDWYFYQNSYDVVYEGEKWHRMAADRGSRHSASRLMDYYSRQEGQEYYNNDPYGTYYLYCNAGGKSTLNWIPNGHGDVRDYNEIFSKFGRIAPANSLVVETTLVDRRIKAHLENMY